MSTNPSSRFEVVQQAQLAVLLDAVGDVPISDTERRALQWLAGWEAHVVQDIAAVIRRCRESWTAALIGLTEPAAARPALDTCTTE